MHCIEGKIWVHSWYEICIYTFNIILFKNLKSEKKKKIKKELSALPVLKCLNMPLNSLY